MYVPGDPAITCPSLFKGSCSPLVLASLYLTYYVLRPYLIRQYLGFCWPCGVTLAGTALYVCLVVYVDLSLFIIMRANVYLVLCVLMHITLHGGA